MTALQGSELPVDLVKCGLWFTEAGLRFCILNKFPVKQMLLVYRLKLQVARLNGTRQWA